MKVETEFALLLTASVDPKGMPGVTQPNPIDREDTYADCLTYYLESHPRVQQIVFAENSGWPLDRLREVSVSKNPHSKQIEFLSFDCNHFHREKGKSYGELLLMEKALEESRLLQKSRYIGKMTGRNLLLNLTALLESMPTDFQLSCDIRDHNFYELLGMPDCGHHCESRFFVFTRSFYERHLQGTLDDLPFANGYMIEGLLYDLVKKNESTERVIKRFRIEPNFRGSAGHFMKGKRKDYGSAGEILKRSIRSCSRRVAPWLHI
jgi:hypothetical protein